MEEEHQFDEEEENEEYSETSHPKVLQDQLELPIGLAFDGSPITLDDYRSNEVKFFSISEQFENDNFNEKELKNLVIERIKMVKNYGAFSFNNVHVDREKAIEEVRRGTSLGQYIVEIEVETINAMMEILNKE